MHNLYKRYGLFGLVKLLSSLIYTKIFYPSSRLIRLPFDVRNRKHIDFGKNLTTGFGSRIEAHPIDGFNSNCILFGSNVEINDYVHIAAGEKIIIGNNVLIASKVFITDLNHGSYKGDYQDSPATTPNARKLSTSPVLIKDNVWLGEGVCVMPGVTIGQGSIIGAMSVVTKNIPDNSIAVGSPAKVIKQYNFQLSKWVKVDDLYKL